MSRYGPVKQVALLACLTHTARMRARDDLAKMLCKRMASHVKRAKVILSEACNVGMVPIGKPNVPALTRGSAAAGSTRATCAPRGSRPPTPG